MVCNSFIMVHIKMLPYLLYVLRTISKNVRMMIIPMTITAIMAPEPVNTTNRECFINILRVGKTTHSLLIIQWKQNMNKAKTTRKIFCKQNSIWRNLNTNLKKLFWLQIADLKHTLCEDLFSRLGDDCGVLCGCEPGHGCCSGSLHL